MTKLNVAVIPARSGSKGLPGKNKRLLVGKPLILHTVDSAISSGVFDLIIVSTNDPEIKLLLDDAKYEKIVVDQRPEKISSDKTEMFDVLTYLIEKYSLHSDTLLTLLQPTSPLRNENDISEAFNLFDETKYKALISIVETENTVLKNCLISNNVLEGIRSSDLLFKNRQSLPKTYKPNGAIYIYKVKDLIVNNGFHLDLVLPYLMTQQKSLDIDNLNDFERIESILN